MKSQVIKTALIAFAMLFAFPSLAQNDSIVEEEVIEEEIVEEVIVEDAVIDDKIAEEIERALEEVEMSEEELERALEQVEQALENIDMEVIEIDSPVTDSTGKVIFEEKNVKVIIKKKSADSMERHITIRHDDHPHKRRYKLVETDWFNMQLGFNQLLNTNNELELPTGYENMKLHNTKSFDFHLHFVQQALRIYKDNIRISYGIGIDFNNYSFTENVVLAKDNDGLLTADVDPNRDFSKNKLATQYLTMPLMLNFKIGDRGRKKFKIAAGANFGYLINSYQRLKWRENGRQSSRVKDDFNLQSLRMGYELQFGYGNIQLYTKYFPDSMFKTGEGPDVSTVAVGLMIGSL